MRDWPRSRLGGLLLLVAVLVTGGLGWATSVLAFLNFFVLGLGALLPLEIKGLAATDGTLAAAANTVAAAEFAAVGDPGIRFMAVGTAHA